MCLIDSGWPWVLQCFCRTHATGLSPRNLPQGSMVTFLKKTVWLLYKAADNLIDHDGVELSGYLAFLSLLSLFPFLVLVVATAGWLGQGELGTQFVAMVLNYAPEQALSSLKPRIDEIMSGPPEGFVTISILGAIWTASSAVEGWRLVLNRAYHVYNPPVYYLRRLLSILQLLMFMLLVLIAMSVVIFAPLLFKKLQMISGIPIPASVVSFWHQYAIHIGILVLYVAVAGLYYVLPNIKHRLLSILPGAALAVALLVAGAYGFGVYITHASGQVNLIYGSLGSYIATLVFFYIMHIFFIYGAEFNYLLAQSLGKPAEEMTHEA